MAFTAKDVQALRERTNCGMMDCKKALTQADGDMEKAVEILREKGLAAATKKAGRIAAEGVVLATVDPDTKVGVVIEVNSETDFVAKNESFMEFVKSCAKTVAANKPADVDALLKLPAVGLSMTIEEELRDKILTIGENLKIRRFAYADGVVETYVHGGGRIGVMVSFDTDVADKEGFSAYAKDVAMQIAAINPAYLDEDSVPAEVLAHEKEILKAQIANDEKLKNKPAQIIEKMVDGRIGKYYKENCLMDQPFVKNGDQTVRQYTEETAKALGGSIKVKSFVRFEKGEGLEKREENFAEEIAKMVK
ncbi:MAG TPA: translation elongation factor Ts [Candidatus Anaerotruncus excrementipullorum]|uniref:Elongation factor Ts n=1 Tax=Candidatus Anaerotruncus excrementipullorum TaxID=2838465 RepID=A0A9D1WSL1_9FIRM|nr:translation elongation factor Ts [Candidatus Anaerotruncus excrementipullorum]